MLSISSIWTSCGLLVRRENDIEMRSNLSMGNSMKDALKNVDEFEVDPM